MYLVEDGMQVVMWIGTQVSPKFISALFGVGTLDELNHPTGELTLPVLESDINIRCRAIVDSICSHPYRYRLARPRYATTRRLPVPWQRTYRSLACRIFRAKDAGERAFYDMLVEDAKRQQASYVDFLCNIHRHIQCVAGHPSAVCLPRSEHRVCRAQEDEPEIGAIAIWTGMKRSFTSSVGLMRQAPPTQTACRSVDSRPSAPLSAQRRPPRRGSAPSRRAQRSSPGCRPAPP